MYRLIITNVNINEDKKMVAALLDDNEFVSIDILNKDEILNNIYVGKVVDISKNISAAFIDYEKNKRGYFSLETNKNPIFLNPKNTDKLCVGDEILVKIEKDAVKSKFPSLSSKLSFKSDNMIFSIPDEGVFFSKKIDNDDFTLNLKPYLENHLKDFYDKTGFNAGLIIRTSAGNLDTNVLKEEADELINKMTDLFLSVKTKTKYSLIYKGEKAYERILSSNINDIDVVITDIDEVYDDLKERVESYKNISIEKYEDDWELSKRFGIEKDLNELLKKNVWLKSGANIVIEYTEALTVIDVNSGKNIKGKNHENTNKKINFEAAKEIARQLRLRNISGIIIIDFLNMKEEDNKRELLSYLAKEVGKDPVLTNVVSMTKLNLVEVTRKKIASPIYEKL
ncbi:ribonuclease G [Lachnospiraceae bacterium RM5]|nr:ribonuclease G [Lachnospiraceae bacterium RM5]